MTHHTGAVPDTRRKTDWRDNAACSDTPTSLFFTKGSEETAKAHCRRCPVINECLAYAFDEGIGFGVFGGLTDRERTSVVRAKARNNLSPKEVAARVARARTPHRERTLSAIVEQATTPLSGGHVAWRGSEKVHYQGRVYTPKQAVFVADRGHEPDGRVQATCGIDACVQPQHIRDQRERAAQLAVTPAADPKLAACGTRSAYQRHVRNKEPIDDACRAANTVEAANFRQIDASDAA